MIKKIIFCAILRPLILRNYEKRRRGEGPDEWYWADVLALKWGYTVDLRPVKTHFGRSRNDEAHRAFICAAHQYGDDAKTSRGHEEKDSSLWPCVEGYKGGLGEES